MTGLDHLRPTVHVRPRDGWVNDPNGPILVDRVWHLYFQYRRDVADGPISWGHASSPDLAHWTVHPTAIEPGESPLDRDGIWSGNSVLVDGRLVAFHSGHLEGRALQSTLRRESLDGGATFGAAVVAVPDPDPSAGVQSLRDPFVWREGTTWWLALGASTGPRSPGVRLHRSDDLHDWHDAGALVADETDSPWADLWECPQVIDVDGTRCVLVGAYTPGEPFGPVLALTGPAGARDFAPTVARFDEGPDLYAPSAFRDGPDGPLVWGWILEAREQSWWADDGWAGMLSLPRVVSADVGGGIRVAPAPQLRALRGEPMSSADRTPLSVPAAFEASLRPGPGITEVVLRFGVTERLVIRLDLDGGLLVIDRTASSLDDRAVRDVIRVEDAELDGELRLFVDGSVIELFTARGRSLTARVYPLAPPPWTVESSAAAGLVVWPLRASVRDESSASYGPSGPSA